MLHRNILQCTIYQLRDYIITFAEIKESTMQNEIIEKMNEAGKTSYSALQKLSAINTKAVKELAELQMGLVTYNIESSVEFTKIFSGTTNYSDLLNAESEFANQYGSKVMEYSRKTADVLTESRDEVVAWFEKTVESASNKAKPAAKRTSKKAA